MKWQICPVCEGRGIVPQGFYSYPLGQEFATSSNIPEQCKSCTGEGKILEPLCNIVYNEINKNENE